MSDDPTSPDAPVPGSAEPGAPDAPARESAPPPTTGSPTASRRDRAPESARRPAKPTRRIPRGPILLVVLLALVVAVVAQSNAPSESGTAAAVDGGVGVPAADVASSAWYCAAGTSARGGAANETVTVASLARDRIEATVTVFPGGDAAPGTKTLQLAPGEQVHVAVSDVLATAEPGVLVETVGGAAAVSHVVTHGSDFGLEACTRTSATDWYFASGTTADGGQQQLVLFNPFGDDAIVDVSFVTDTGGQEPAALQAMVVPRRSRITVPVQDSVLRQTRVATRVHARTGRVVAEQTQVFDDVTVDGSTRDGIALSLGAPAPSPVWHLAAGSTADGGTGTLALANFTDTEARVDVKVFIADGTSVPAQTVRVPSQGLVDTEVTARVPLGSAYAVEVTSRERDGRRVPVVAELLATWSPRAVSSGVAGTVAMTVTADRWVVPVPTVDAEQVITVYNPGPSAVTAELLPAGAVDRRVGVTSAPEVAIPAGAVRTVRVAQVNAGRDAVVVTAQHPIVVGLTVLGRAGAAVTAAIPDLTRAG